MSPSRAAGVKAGSVAQGRGDVAPFPPPTAVACRGAARPEDRGGRPNCTPTGLEFLSCRRGQAHENPPCPLGLDGGAEHRDRMQAYQTTQHWHCPVRKHRSLKQQKARPVLAEEDARTGSNFKILCLLFTTRDIYVVFECLTLPGDKKF